MRFLDETWSDLRFALRSLRRAPGFTATVLVTLVGGIAAVTTIFSYLNDGYFVALPYRGVERMVAVSGGGGIAALGSFNAVPSDELRLIRSSNRSFARVAAFDAGYTTVMFGTEPRPIFFLRVDSSFVPLFDLRPEFGRLLSGSDVAGQIPVAMISSALWQTQYGADPAAIGARLELSGRTYRIVGVMPPGFRFPYQTDAIVPLRAADPGRASRDTSYAVVAKLRPGVSREAARSEMRVIASQFSSSDRHAGRADLELHDEPLDRRAQALLPFPSLFLGAGLFVLLIACTNVTNLFLVRTAERRSEMAVRASLGAGRARLIRQALTETLLLAAIAAALGTAAAAALVRVGLHFIPTQGFPSWFHLTVDWHVLAFAVGTTVAVTLVVGITPATEGSHFDLVRALKQGGDGGAASSGITRQSHRGMVAALALAVPLFILAALLVRSYQHLSHIDPGYAAERIATVTPFFDQSRYPDAEQRLRVIEQVAERATQIPQAQAVAIEGSGFGLKAAAKAAAQKGAGTTIRNDFRLIPDRDTLRAVRGLFVNQTAVSNEYFQMLGLRLLQGRSFARDDIEGSTPVAVVNTEMAKRLWPHDSPLGRLVQIGALGDPFMVIGVVPSVGQIHRDANGLRTDPLPALYVSVRQVVTFNARLLITGPGDPLVLRAHAVELMRGADPTLIFSRDVTMASQFDAPRMETRVFGGLLGVLALGALALAIVGIYGMVAFGVARRTREIGIRVALGATGNDVLRFIIRDGLRFAALGLVIGLVFAAGLSRIARVLLYGVSPLDPIAYGAVCVLFGATAVVACYVPARRATKVDPLIALRSE